MRKHKYTMKAARLADMSEHISQYQLDSLSDIHYST